jgi:hypothetical protein
MTSTPSKIAGTTQTRSISKFVPRKASATSCVAIEKPVNGPYRAASTARTCWLDHGIELVTVEPATIRTAESKIAGCERCRNDESDIPFNFVIADVLKKHGAFDFMLSEPGRCPSCRAELTEKTLVEPQGGIEVETMA